MESKRKQEGARGRGGGEGGIQHLQVARSMTDNNFIILITVINYS